MDFMEVATQAGSRFLQQTPKDKPILIMSHFDTDGLCACAILQKALTAQGYIIKTKQVPHLDDDALVGIEEDTVLFADIGANKIKEISQSVKQAYVLDHHDGSETAQNVEHINPHVHDNHYPNIISGAGVAYFFVLGMDSKNRELADIGVLGALGDSQEKDGFIEFNDIILQHAIIQKSITVSKRPKLYGINSRPLLKVLEYSTDIEIPGVTNNEQGAKQFFRDLGIYYSFKARNGERPRLKKYYHLRDDEKERLVEKILELKGGDTSILVNAYTFNRPYQRELKDGREYATVINACGRLGEYNVALACLQGNEEAQKKAAQLLREYRYMLRQTLHEVQDNKDSYIQGDGYVIIDLEDKVKPSMVGIIASILARNKHFEPGIVVCTLGKQNDTETKISMRVSHDVQDKGLQHVLSDVVQKLGSTAGGHDNAAGAVIATEKKHEFIEQIQVALQ